MSHTATHKQKITNLNLFASRVLACGGQFSLESKVVNLYGRNNVEAVASFKLPGWHYELAVTPEGEIKYDNYRSAQGSMDTLGNLIQDYNVELVTMQMPVGEKVGSYYTETLPNGDKKLVMEYN